MNFKIEIAKMLNNITDFPLNDISDKIEIPANKTMGDYAFPCFVLAKTFKKAPPVIANELAGKIPSIKFIDKVEVVGGYINFFLNKEVYGKEVISSVLEKGEKYGDSEVGKGKTIVIDYSSPNIAKPFHIGHLRSTVIGNAIYKLYETLGYKCVGVNHLGDWGTQFGKLIVAYRNWGNKEDVNNGGVNELVRLYVKFHEVAEEDKSLEDEARFWFVKMQDGDKEALELWKWFYDISIIEFQRVYNMLGVEFDYFTGESFYNDKMDKVVQELKDKNLLVESEGALIVDLEDKNMPPCLIIRKDGGTLYATRDITAGLYRKETYDFHKCVYLTALDQNLHFAQWFEVVSKMGYDWAKDLVHVPFGLVSIQDSSNDSVKKLGTRTGNVILMEQLLNESIAETKKIIENKNPDLEDKDEVAKKVGIGAIIFNDLYNSRIKDVVFSWERMLNFDGETGPYVQYTYARACSVIRKAGDFSTDNLDYSVITDESSLDVLKNIESYPQKIVDATEKLEPSIFTRHLVNIAQSFNKFYHDNQILSSEENVKEVRLAIVLAVKILLEKGLGLLGIDAPTKM